MERWWRLGSNGDTVTYTRQRAGYKEYIQIYTEEKSVSFGAETFVLHNDRLASPQSKETNEFVRYSAKYGTWCRDDPKLTEEDLEFALKALKAEEKSDGSKNRRCGY